MTAATAKAVLVHTADEAGSSDGPDYQNGWGLMNTETASELITQDGYNPRVIQELTLLQGQTITQIFPNLLPVFRITIAWTDPPGTPTTDQLDPSTPMLVNDLDIRISGPGSSSGEFTPWVLDPSMPANAATYGDNTRDNIEQIEIKDHPPVNGNFTIEITHKGILQGGFQNFTLIAPLTRSLPSASAWSLLVQATLLLASGACLSLRQRFRIPRIPGKP